MNSHRRYGRTVESSTIWFSWLYCERSAKGHERYEGPSFGVPWDHQKPISPYLNGYLQHSVERQCPHNKNTSRTMVPTSKNFHVWQRLIIEKTNWRSHAFHSNISNTRMNYNLPVLHRRLTPQDEVLSFTTPLLGHPQNVSLEQGLL